MIVNLSSVKHLAISSHCEVMPSSMLLELLKQAPQISSLTTDRKSVLIVLIMNLTKLSRIHATISSSISSAEIYCVQKDLQKSRIKICDDFDDDQPSKLTIWIIRNITEELLI
jgi:hypothetical protein